MTTLYIILADLLRRSAHFAEGEREVQNGLAVCAEDTLTKCLHYEASVISGRDTLCHKAEEAFKVNL